MKRMKLFTRAQKARLLRHGADPSEDKDYPPVVKLFTPDAQAAGLISENGTEPAIMERMPLFTNEQWMTLLKNGAAPSADKDHPPVIKLFTPDAQATWLLSKIHPDRPVFAFALCDLGLGHPELGYVAIPELKSLRGPLGMPVERDKGFEGPYPLSVYAEAASAHGRITTSEAALEKAAWKLGQEVTVAVERDEEMER